MNGLTWLINPPAQIPQPTGGRVVRLLRMDEKVTTLVDGDFPPDEVALQVAADKAQEARERQARRAEKHRQKKEAEKAKRKVRRLTQHDLLQSILRARPGMTIHELAIVTNYSLNVISVILGQSKMKGRARSEMKDAAGKAIYPAKWYAVDGVQP
jgi:hypothetical protein